MVEAAAGPENAGMTWGRALLTPATGSDLEFGQIPLEGFFFEDHVLDSEFELCAASAVCGCAATVDVDEVVDAREDDEFDL